MYNYGLPEFSLNLFLRDNNLILGTHRNSRCQHLIYSITIHIHNLVPQFPRYYMVYHCWNSLQEENYQLGNSSVVSKFIPGKEHTDKTSLSFSTGLSQSSTPSILFNPRLNKIFKLVLIIVFYIFKKFVQVYFR
jgi:hypothetical protein